MFSAESRHTNYSSFGNVYADFVFFVHAFFVFELAARTGQTGEQTDRQTDKH